MLLRITGPPSIVFGAVKKIEVEIAGGDYREVEKKASLTFKEVAFGIHFHIQQDDTG